MIPDAIEEVLRLEPPGPHVGRYVAADAEFQGRTVPARSAILFLVGSANHDEREFPDPDRFDLHRTRAAHVTFGYGIHTCIGNVLARLEGRVVYEELLKRIPEWDIAMDHASLLSTSTVRGWDTLPAYVNARGASKIKARAAEQIGESYKAASGAPTSVAGKWIVTVKGPTGAMDSTLTLESSNGSLSGSQSGEGVTVQIQQITYDSATGNIAWSNQITKPMKLTLQFTGTVQGGSMTGKVKAGFMGTCPFTAKLAD